MAEKNNSKKFEGVRKYTVRKQLSYLVIIAVAVSSIALGIVSVLLSRGEIIRDYKKSAQIATAHLKNSLEYFGDWSCDSETGKIYCGDSEITVDLFLTINADDPTVSHTIFLDDTRVITNIKDNSGNYVLGTQADATIYKRVKAGETYTDNSVKIINDKYTVCYMPLYDKKGEFFGMMFTGINQAAVNKSVFFIVIAIAVASVLILVLMSTFGNKLLSKISNILSGRLKKGYHEIENFADGVKIISDRTDKEVDEISKAMTNLASDAMGQAAATEEAMASTEEFTNSIDVVNNEITESYEYINMINDCVNASENSMSELNNSIESNNVIVENVSADIRLGVESTKKANSIVKTIDGLALQINLLALNASVEASHAGQFGKGFAVVAEEIKNLATNSAASAKETADIIAEIVKTMNKTSESNARLVEANKEQADKAEDVRNKMEILKQNIDGIKGKLTTIHERANSLVMVKEDLVQVVSKLSTTSEQNAAVAQEVSASTENVDKDVAELSRNIEGISEICDELRDLIAFFG